MNIRTLNHKTKKIFLIVAGTLALLILVAALFGSSGTLSATSTPTPIKVKINNTEYQTPFTTRLRTGEYKVEATKENYMPIETTIIIRPFSKTEINFPMVSTDNEDIEYADIEALAKLPYDEEHFGLDYIPDVRVLEVIPRIPFDSSAPPEWFFNEYWSDYENYGKEALQWLEQNGLGQKVREENQITIKWWGQDLWPAGAKIE